MCDLLASRGQKRERNIFDLARADVPPPSYMIVIWPILKVFRLRKMVDFTCTESKLQLPIPRLPIFFDCKVEKWSRRRQRERERENKGKRIGEECDQEKEEGN